MTKTLGIARTHDELIRLIDKGRCDLRLTLLEADDVVGLAGGHVSHLLSCRPDARSRRTLGQKSMDALLSGLGLALRILVDSDEVECGSRAASMVRKPRKNAA